MLHALLLLTAASPAPAGPAISRVVVFADRAAVARRARFRCKAGAASAEFGPLAPTLDPRSLRARTISGGTVIGTASEVHEGTEALSARGEQLRQEIEKLGDEIATFEDERKALDEEQAKIDAYVAVLRGVLTEAIRNPKPAIAKWESHIESFRARGADLAGRRADVQTKLRKVRATLNRAHREQARLGGGRSKAYRSAMVTVDCGQARSVDVELAYVVPGARWQPEYDVDFTPNKGRRAIGAGTARFTVSAVVQQSTGEDWTGVELLLSTAKPKLGAEAPQPAPLYINGYESKEGNVLVEAKERRSSLRAGDAAAARGPQSVALEDKGQSFVLRLPRKVTVLSDGRPYWMPVDVLAANAAAKLVTIPKLSPYMFRLLELNNPAPYPLLAGRIHSYRSGSFVGDSSLRYKGLGEPMEISLGVDESFHVTRKPLVEKSESARLLSSTKRLRRAYRIAVTNRTRSAQTIEVRENIPVSKIEDVEVEVHKEQTSPGHTVDDNQGFVTWTSALESGGKQELDLAYTIHLPDDWKVNVH